MALYSRWDTVPISRSNCRRNSSHPHRRVKRIGLSLRGASHFSTLRKRFLRDLIRSAETEQAYAETLGEFMKDQFSHKPRIFCLVNGKRFVCLIRTERMVAEEEKQAIWKKSQELALSAIPRYPTVAIAFYRQEQRYGTLLVGGATEEYYLRKEGGAFTLYPYF